jgi:hypothetical protein
LRPFFICKKLKLSNEYKNRSNTVRVKRFLQPKHLQVELCWHHTITIQSSSESAGISNCFLPEAHNCFAVFTKHSWLWAMFGNYHLQVFQLPKRITLGMSTIKG